MGGRQKASEIALRRAVCKVESQVHYLAEITRKKRNSVNYTLQHNYYCTRQ